MVRERMTQHLSQRIDDIRQGVQGKDDILSYIIRGEDIIKLNLSYHLRSDCMLMLTFYNPEGIQSETW